jgi:hypothetical protein
MIRCAVALALCLAAPAALAAGKLKTHDEGLHGLFAIGGAFVSTGVTSDPEPDRAPDVSVSGAAVGAMLLVGWTLSDGLAVGAGGAGFHVFSPTLTVDDTEITDDLDPLAGMVLGPYAVYYLDPAGGVNFLGQLGVATLQDTDPDTDDIAIGFGATLGVGYDMYVGDNLSVGGMARFQFLSTSLDHDVAGSAVTVSHTSVVPALLLTVAWN